MANRIDLIKTTMAVMSVVFLLLYTASSLRPCTPLCLAVILSGLLYLVRVKNKKFVSYLFVAVLAISMLYIFFPIKFVISRSSGKLIKLTPIHYGLVIKEKAEKIRAGDVYPGGEYVSVLDPKYAILINLGR